MRKPTIQQIITTSDHAAAQFGQAVTRSEQKMFEEALLLIKDLETTPNGNIKTSVANLKKVQKIRTKLYTIANNKEYRQAVQELVDTFDTIYDQQLHFYAVKHQSSRTSEKYNLVKTIARENTIAALTGDGLAANVTAALDKMLLRAVTTGERFADLQKELTNTLTSDNHHAGTLSRYAKTYAVTALSQYAGQNNKLFTDDLGTDWFEYVGSEIETTRPFCEACITKRYIHRSEFPDLLAGHIRVITPTNNIATPTHTSTNTNTNIDTPTETSTDTPIVPTIEEIEVPLYDRTGLPYGMIEGTTIDNFQVNVGGWNCRHQLIPIAPTAVPQHIRKIVEKNKVGDSYKVPTTSKMPKQDEIEKALSITKGKPMVFEKADGKHPNPHYKLNEEHKVNCQTCVVAYELRRRGYDVEALGNPGGESMTRLLSYETRLAWLDDYENIPSMLTTGTSYYDKKTFRKKYNKIDWKEIENFTSQVGRYHISCTWKNNESAHIFTLERLPNGKILSYDPQTGRSGVLREYSLKMRGDIRVYRVDNLHINPHFVLPVLAKSGTKAANCTQKYTTEDYNLFQKLRPRAIIKSVGGVKVNKQRKHNAEKSKNELAKFDKEHHMCMVFASKGADIEMLQEKPRVSSCDILYNGIPAELKSVTSHHNIVKYAKKAIRIQGAEIVLFEFVEFNEKYKKELRKLSDTYNIHGKYYIVGDENIYEF